MPDTTNTGQLPSDNTVALALMHLLSGGIGAPAAEPAAAPGAAPGGIQTTPVAPNLSATPTSPDLDPAQVGAAAMQRGTQMTEEQLQRGRTAGDQAAQLINRPLSTRDPVYGFKPSWDSIHGTPATPAQFTGDSSSGIGGVAPGQPGKPATGGAGIVHNILQLLATAGVSTAPGRQVEQTLYGRDIAARQAELAERASDIGKLQKQQEQEFAPVGATARMGPAYIGR